jgi:hypothetical protein
MSMRKLKKVIRKNWGVRYRNIDKDTPLIVLAEKIAMEDMNCTREEAYEMYIDKPSLHLPGLISIYIIDEMGFKSKNINAGMTLSEIFTLENLEK